jgi:hypothetical protein
MKRLLLIAIVVPLMLATNAEAKGLKWVKVCGPTDCSRTPARDLNFEKTPLIFPPWVMSGGPDNPPKQAGKWLRVVVASPHSDRRMRSVVMPAMGYAGGDQGGGYGFVWEHLSNAAQGTYLRLGRGLERYPAETVPGLGGTSHSRNSSVVVDRPVVLTVGSIFKQAGWSVSRSGGAAPQVINRLDRD